MIEKLNLDNKNQIREIEDKFPQYFKGKELEETLKNNRFRSIYTLSTNQEIAGILILDIIYERMELIEIEVLENKRNLGYGKKLLEFMIEKAQEENVGNITLEVKTTNSIAIHLYEKYGFKEVAIRKNYYQGIDGILMERKMM